MRTGHTAVVSLPAEVDIANSGDVHEALLTVIETGVKVIVADLGKTTFCDSSGVSALARAHRRSSSNGAILRLVVSGPAIERLMRLTGVDELIQIHPTVSAALGSSRRS